jgi:hypothetical protein
MSLHRKKWSKKDKEEVLLYNDQHGVSQTPIQKLRPVKRSLPSTVLTK